MTTTIQYTDVENKIIMIRNEHVILDSDVAELYGVETKKINEAVMRNLEKFPQSYIYELTDEEWAPVKSQIATSPLGGGKVKRPKAFTEKNRRTHFRPNYSRRFNHERIRGQR